MNGKTTLKIMLDLTMAVLFGLLLWDRGAGLFFHEVAGLGIGALFLLHITLNRKPIRGLVRTTASGSAPLKVSFMLLLDLMLTVGMTAVILSGILMSKVLFPIDWGIGEQILFQIHYVSSYACLGIVTAHLLMHTGYLYKAVRQIGAHWRESGVRKTAARFTAAALAVGVLYLYAFSAYKNSGAAIYNGTATVSSAGASSQTQNSTKKDDDAGTSSGSSDTQAAPVSLSDYLSKLYCTGCHNHCPLSSPQCGRSYQQIQEATQEYRELYTSGT